MVIVGTALKFWTQKILLVNIYAVMSRTLIDLVDCRDC